MNTLELEDDWNIVRGKIKQKHARPTDDDLEFAKGQEKEFSGRFQKRTRKNRTGMERAVNDYDEY